MALGYSNDYMNANIVLFVFLIFYGYLNYNANQLKRARNWSSVTCNPLEILIGSIFDYDSSNKQFEKCMQYSISSDQEKRIHDYSKELNKNLQENINKLDTSSAYKVNATNDILGNTADEINKLNNESLDKEETINEIKTRVARLSEKINSSFDTFKDPSNNLLSNLAL